MVQCKLCGIELGSFQDYDQVQYHCWKYHPDTYESYNPFERRNKILVADSLDETSKRKR